jgi:hypothetical protein
MMQSPPVSSSGMPTQYAVRHSRPYIDPRQIVQTNATSAHLPPWFNAGLVHEQLWRIGWYGVWYEITPFVFHRYRQEQSTCVLNGHTMTWVFQTAGVYRTISHDVLMQHGLPVVGDLFDERMPTACVVRDSNARII